MWRNIDALDNKGGMWVIQYSDEEVGFIFENFQPFLCDACDAYLTEGPLLLGYV